MKYALLMFTVIGLSVYTYQQVYADTTVCRGHIIRVSHYSPKERGESHLGANGSILNEIGCAMNKRMMKRLGLEIGDWVYFVDRGVWRVIDDYCPKNRVDIRWNESIPYSHNNAKVKKWLGQQDKGKERVRFVKK
jgi:hypothetical protein